MYLVACFCKHLIVLRCTNVSLSAAFHAILVNNPCIQEIRIEGGSCMLINMMNEVSLHKLQLLSVSHVRACKYGLPWSATTHSSSLQRVECSFIPCYSQNIAELCTSCPHLRSFGCRGITFDDKRLISFFESTYLLINLDISFNTAVTDASVLFIAANLVLLRTLNIQKCTNLTIFSLAHITGYCDELQVLHIDIMQASRVTEDIVKRFSEECSSIAYLNINCSFVLCQTTCTSSLLKGCPNLDTIVVNKQETICASSREFCSLLRPQLKILVHDKSTEYNVLTMPI